MIYITALLFVQEGKEELFQDYERRVLPLLKDFNAEILYRIRANKEKSVSLVKKLPYEVHILEFQTETDFKNYLNDDRRKAFEHLKNEAIKSTFVIKGEKL